MSVFFNLHFFAKFNLSFFGNIIKSCTNFGHSFFHKKVVYEICTFFGSLRKLYGGFCSKNCNCMISVWNCTKIVQKLDDFFSWGELLSHHMKLSLFSAYWVNLLDKNLMINSSFDLSHYETYTL